MANDININVVAQVQGAIAPLRQVEQQVQRVGGQVDRSTSAVRNNAMAYSRNGTQLRRWAKGALQQAGFQVGDFAVQVANGTNGIQAFGQQGSQLLGIFGPIGAVLGAAVAIFSAVAVAASKAGGEVQNLGGVLGSLETPVRSAIDAVKEFGQIFGGFGQVILQNVDTLLILIGLIGVRYVIGVIRAAAVTTTFTGVMYGLGVAVGTVNKILMRFLPFLILAGIAKMIELFMRAVNGVGGFGEALKLVGNLLLEFVNYGGIQLRRFLIFFEILYNDVKLIWAKMIQFMSQELADFLTYVAPTINGIADLLQMDDIVDPMGMQAWASSFEGPVRRIEAEIEALRRQSRDLNNEGLEGILTAWNELADAVRAGTQEVVIFGDTVPDALQGAGDEVDEINDKINSLYQSIGKSIEDAFMSIVDGTKSAKEAFKAMARDIIAQLYRVLVVQRMVGSFNVATGEGSGIVGALGKVFGGFGMRAQGGAVSANRPYIVGEKGPEMLVPSTSGRVIPNNQLGGGGGQVIVNQTINVSTGVQQTVRTEIKQMMPQIAESAKQAVVDAKRRGGSYGRAFA